MSRTAATRETYTGGMLQLEADGVVFYDAFPAEEFGVPTNPTLLDDSLRFAFMPWPEGYENDADGMIPAPEELRAVFPALQFLPLPQFVWGSEAPSAGVSIGIDPYLGLPSLEPGEVRSPYSLSAYAHPEGLFFSWVPWQEIRSPDEPVTIIDVFVPTEPATIADVFEPVTSYGIGEAWRPEIRLPELPRGWENFERLAELPQGWEDLYGVVALPTTHDPVQRSVQGDLPDPEGRPPQDVQLPEGAVVYDRFPVEEFGAPLGSFWHRYPGQFVFIPYPAEPLPDPHPYLVGHRKHEVIHISIKGVNPAYSLEVMEVILPEEGETWALPIGLWMEWGLPPDAPFGPKPYPYGYAHTDGVFLPVPLSPEDWYQWRDEWLAATPDPSNPPLEFEHEDPPAVVEPEPPAPELPVPEIPVAVPEVPTDETAPFPPIGVVAPPTDYVAWPDEPVFILPREPFVEITSPPYEEPISTPVRVIFQIGEAWFPALPSSPADPGDGDPDFAISPPGVAFAPWLPPYSEFQSWGVVTNSAAADWDLV